VRFINKADRKTFTKKLILAGRKKATLLPEKLKMEEFTDSSNFAPIGSKESKQVVCSGTSFGKTIRRKRRTNGWNVEP